MPTPHPFMCYIHQGNVLKGTICSQYTDQAWHEDITHRNITLVFEIAESLAMRYLAFGISTNNYEWTVLHVQDRENNLPVNVMLPDGLSGSVKFGVKLYDAPPSVGSIINVGFDYVITGGFAMSDAGKTITMSCETDGATIRYTLDGSEPTETSLEYTGEFTVEPPVTIKARGYKDGMLAGEVTVKEVDVPWEVIKLDCNGENYPVTAQTETPIASESDVIFYDFYATVVDNSTQETLLDNVRLQWFGQTHSGAAPIYRDDTINEVINLYIGYNQSDYNTFAPNTIRITFGRALVPNPADPQFDATVRIDIIPKVKSQVPMGSKLFDRSVIFYDRGEQYGDYNLTDGYLIRLSEGVDDGSGTSANWRFLICDRYDLTMLAKWGETGKMSGADVSAVGYGLPNTGFMISKYGTDSDYIWYSVLNPGYSSDEKWFLPSFDELELVYQNKDLIVSAGVDDFEIDMPYFSSTAHSIMGVYCLDFSDGSTSMINERSKLNYCRLIRRI